MRKPKFKIGDRVLYEGRVRKVLRVHFDPCDGFEYQVERQKGPLLRLVFEEDLAALAAARKG